MSALAEKQIPTRKKLEYTTDTKQDVIEQIAGVKASRTGVWVEKNNGFGHNKHRNGNPQPKRLEMGTTFNAARFMQCTHLALYRRNLDYYLENPDEFVERVVGIYRLLAAAENALRSLKPKARACYENYLAPC